MNILIIAKHSQPFTRAGSTAAQLSYQVDGPGVKCCYGRATFSNGQTVVTLPECCASLVCDNGDIKPRHFGPPGSSGCKYLKFKRLKCSGTIRTIMQYIVACLTLSQQVVNSTDRCIPTGPSFRPIACLSFAETETGFIPTK